MGEAKSRGTKADRVEQAIERDRIQAEKDRAAFKEAEARRIAVLEARRRARESSSQDVGASRRHSAFGRQQVILTAAMLATLGAGEIVQKETV